MDKFLLVMAVLAIVGFARSKMGDENYNGMVINGFKWLFGLLFALFIGAVIYNRLLT